MWNQWASITATAPLTAFVTPPLPTAAPPPPPSEPAPHAQPRIISVPAVVTAPTAAVTPALPSNSDTVLPVDFNSAAAGNPYSQYTAAQYAAMTPEQQYALQQHWQQWQTYQEEYAKWHAQYGEQYKREMQAAAASNPAYADYYQQQLSASAPVPTPAPASAPTPTPTPVPAASIIPSTTISTVAATATPSKPIGQQQPIKITGQPQLYTQPPPAINLNQYNSNKQNQNANPNPSQTSITTQNRIQYTRPPPMFNVTQPPPSLSSSLSSQGPPTTTEKSDYAQNSSNNYENNSNQQRNYDDKISNKELNCGANDNGNSNNWTNNNRGNCDGNLYYDTFNSNNNMINNGNDNKNNNNNCGISFQTNRDNIQGGGGGDGGGSNWCNTSNNWNTTASMSRGHNNNNSSSGSLNNTNWKQRGSESNGNSNWYNNNQRRGDSGGVGKDSYSSSQKQPELDEESFDRQFREWEEQFDQWKRANANHPDRAMYRRYEQEFEKQRRRIIERREQMRRRKIQLGKSFTTEAGGHHHDPLSVNIHRSNDVSDQNSFSTARSSTDGNSVDDTNVSKYYQHQEQQPQMQLINRIEKSNVDVIDNKEKCEQNANVINEIDRDSVQKQQQMQQQYSNDKSHNSNLLGKRKSRFSEVPAKTFSSDSNRTNIINLDDDNFHDNELTNDGNDTCKSEEKITELFRKSDGIPGLDLVGEAGNSDKIITGETTKSLKDNGNNDYKNQSNQLTDVQKIETTVKKNSNSTVIPEIAKSLNDPEFMKKISDAVAKAQGKNATSSSGNNNKELGNTDRPLSFAEWQRLKSGGGGGTSSTTNTINISNANNSDRRNLSAERDNSNSNDGSSVKRSSSNDRRLNYNHNDGDNDRKRNDGNSDFNRFGINLGNFCPNPSLFAAQQQFGNNNNFRGRYNGSNFGLGFGHGSGPAPDLNGQFNNYGRNYQQDGLCEPTFNNFNPNFRQSGLNFNSNANANFGPNGPIGPNFGSNGRNFGRNSPFNNNSNNNNFPGNRRNIGNNRSNFNSMDYNGSNNGGGYNNSFNNDMHMNNENKSMMNMNNPFRCQDGPRPPVFDDDNVGARRNYNNNNDNSNNNTNMKNRRDNDSWVKGTAGVNDDNEYSHYTDDGSGNNGHNDYYRRAQIIDYTEKTMTPKVIDYGHKPAQEFKPVQTIDYGHASRPPQRLLQSRQHTQQQQQQQQQQPTKRNAQKRKRRKNKNKTFNSNSNTNTNDSNINNNNTNNLNQEQQQKQILNPINKNASDQQCNQQIVNVKHDTDDVNVDVENGVNKQNRINDKKETNHSDCDLEEVSDTESLPDGCIDMEIVNNDDDDSPAPAPPPPPMLSGESHNFLVKNRNCITSRGTGTTTAVGATKTPMAIFPSTATANENLPQISSQHVQMSLPTLENQNTISIDEILLKPGRLTRPKKICIILRGPPGSGKSHVAKLIKEKEKEMSGGSNPRILSIDDYFLIENDYEEKCPQTGRKITKKEILYEYDKKMEERYMQCLIKSFKKTIIDNLYDFIVVDCTNNSLRSLNEFYCHSKDSGFMPYIIDLYCDLDTCLNRNIHKRTINDIKETIDNWKATPFHYIKLDVQTLLENVVEMEDAENIAVDDHDVSTITDNNSANQTESHVTDTDTNDNDKTAVNNEDDDDESNDDDSSINCGFLKSKWEMDNTSEKMARLDGTSKLGIKRKPTMEEYLQIDDWEPPVSNTVAGKKRVRWADIEEKRKQEKMREVGFVVGQTDWKRMMDPNAAKRALNKMKYIEPIKKKR